MQAKTETSFYTIQLRWAWIFLIPSLLVLILVAAFPLLQTFYYSFTDATLDGLDEIAFTGWENYLILIEDPLWWSSVMNTVVFTLCSVTIETILGLAAALILFVPFKGRGIFRATLLVPWAVPTVVSSKIWEWLFQDQYGIINDILTKLNFIKEPIAFMGNPDLALPTIIAVDVWKTTPFMALLLLAGLGTIPKALYESAKIDGAGPIRSFFMITLPLLKPAILIALIFRSLDAMRVFDIIYIMQGSNDQTASMSIYARQQMIDFQEIGLGSSASFAIFCIISVLTAVYMFTMKADFNK